MKQNYGSQNKQPHILFIDGARNVGKTYLISKLDEQIYKFPFNKLSIELPINKDDEKLFYLTFGYNITILDLAKNGLLNNIIVDRGILSDIVFGLQSKRITMTNAIKFWNIINDTYSEYFDIINIRAEYSIDNRRKDNWVYNAKRTEIITTQFLNIINKNKNKVTHFFNYKDDSSVTRFKSLTNYLLNK